MKGRLIAGRYRLDRLLGEGGNGRVYLARDTRERGGVWAVKELDFSSVALSELEDLRRSFQREADLLQTLHHRSLPRVVAYFQEGHCDYLVMERVEGPTLESVLEQSQAPLLEFEVVRVAMVLAEVLHYLHHRTPPILYRDLKPANVMVATGGQVKLIDFGIARLAHKEGRGDTTAYGTPGYAPPEQYQGRTVPTSDIYALGMTMLRASTLYEPPGVKFSHPRAVSLNPALTLGFDRLIAAMIDKDWERRPQALEVLQRLEELKGQRQRSGAQVWYLHQVDRVKRWWRKGF